jgi:CRISPR-associated protein Cmr6
VRYLPDKNGGLPLSWRAIINLGATSVYETSLLFHRNYSIPYIPGSAVKGVTRQWVILKVSEVSGKKPKEIDDALNKGRNLGLKVDDVSFSDLIGIFGTESQKGEVTFFDALPVIKPNRELVVLDVMNVHYKPYYEKEEPPGDWHKPVPIFFLAVEKGTEFRFALASKNEGLVIKAVNLLGEALKEIGIGAKTSAGYGFFGVSYGDRV